MEADNIDAPGAWGTRGLFPVHHCSFALCRRRTGSCSLSQPPSWDRNAKVAKNKPLLLGYDRSMGVLSPCIQWHAPQNPWRFRHWQASRQADDDGVAFKCALLSPLEKVQKEKLHRHLSFPRNTTIIKGRLTYCCVFGLVSAFKISDVSPAGLKTCAVFTGLINSVALKPVRGFLLVLATFVCICSAACCHLLCFIFASGPTLQTLSLIYLIA